MSGGSILIVWTDIAPELEADFNAWYNHEHLPDRVGRMPGFLRGRRYVTDDAVTGAPKYLTYYDLQDSTVMLSDAHVALRAHRRERDRFFVPRFRNTIKGICDVAGRAGRGGGAYLVLLPVTSLAGRARVEADTLLTTLTSQPGVTGAVYALRNSAITAASSAKDDRAGDRYVDGLVVVEADTQAGAEAAAAMLTPSLASAGLAAQWIESACVLRLMYALAATSGQRDAQNGDFNK